MKTTISVIKADIGAIAGHVKPSAKLIQTVRDYVEEQGMKTGLLIDRYISHTGDDIAILMTHQHGVNYDKIHQLAWNAFLTGTEVAKKQGLYGAGQDILKTAFSGNVKGLGPAFAEMEFEERPNEPFLFFAADKTEPGAYNLPLYLAFSDPMYSPGLLLSTEMQKGFTFTIMDVDYTEGDRVIQLQTPEDAYKIAALLRDNHRFVVESIHSRATGEQSVIVSTSRLHNIAGKYTGKDDPVMLVRVQKQFPAMGEVTAPFVINHYVAGDMRGSHHVPLMPVKLNEQVGYCDGPAIVSCAGFCIQQGKITEPVDVFNQPFWDWVRSRAAEKTYEIRKQGFSGPAMVDEKELEYGGITEVLEQLDKHFTVRKGTGT